ncbi:hypothetical protein [Paenibacillus sp. 37]|uniref:hypothetical protein n=1 Tax=Paenibacillus sp. 37 TaxID=2607911 RepID=UPI00122E5662|nr:hypothetical protein [Paenibacillus sp. 37]
MQFLIKIGICSFILSMFFVANHIHGLIPPSVYRIFGTIGISQIIISYYVWKAESSRMQGLMDCKLPHDEVEKPTMTGPMVRGAVVSLVLCGTLLVPHLIAIGGVWILTYGISFFVVYTFLSKYMGIRQDTKTLRHKQSLSRS